MKCKLCSLPTPTPPIYDGDNAFCCHGCKSVFNVFGADILKFQERSIDSKAKEKVVIEGEEAFLRIEGMHCSSCEILLEHLAKKIEGIYSISTSYATSTAKVIYDAKRISQEQLPELISQSGYKAYYSHEPFKPENEDKEMLWMVTAVGLAGMVMMLNLAFFYPIDLGLVSLQELKPVGWLAFNVAPKAMFVLTTILVFFIGFPILRGAWIGLKTKLLNMDNLLSIAILAAYAYSVGQLLLGELDLYFDVSAVIVGVVTLGRYLEHGARLKATQELATIINNWSPMARVKRNGKLTKCPVSELLPQEILIIKEGEAIPVDGKIISGVCAVDEALINGEPCPISKGPGENVLGGSFVIEGNIEIRIAKIIESRMDNLAKVLWNVQSSARGASAIGQQIARVFVPSVLFLSAAITIWLLLGGSTLTNAMLAGLATLIVSCPCTFGLAVPLTTATAISTALKQGIIFSSADVFEKECKFSSVAIDKTGTLSNGKMQVTKVLGSTKAVEYAVAVERLAKHPIAKAIAQLNSNKTAENITIHPGKGAVANIDEHLVAVGSRTLFNLISWPIPEQYQEQINPAADEVISYIGWDGIVYGAIITQDQKRPEWIQVVNQFKQQHKVIMLTGAEHSSGYEGMLDEVHMGIPPEAKATIIRQLQTEGKVIMIGDGCNDAPALAAADLGIAFGVPTSLAADAADVVIPGHNLNKVFSALNLIKTVRLRVRQNIGWALLYNAIAIPLALAGLLNPLFAALAMACSSLLVVWNSSRPLVEQEEQEETEQLLLGQSNTFNQRGQIF